MTDEELREYLAELGRQVETNTRSLSALGHQVENNRTNLDEHISEVAARQATYEHDTNTRLRRRAFRQFAGLVIAVIVVLSFAGWGLSREGQRIERETRQRDAVSCQDRAEAREGVRLGYVALLEARTSAGNLLVPVDSPVRGVLTNDVLPKLPTITCPA